MTEKLTALTQETPLSEAIAPVDEAHAIVESSNRSIRIGGESYETNLPDGINPLDENASVLRNAGLKPTELDQLSVGDYSIFRKKMDEWADEPTEIVERRDIKVINGEKGKAINEESTQQRWSLQPHTKKLMQVLGYGVAEKEGHAQITSFPIPATVFNAAILVDVDIAFFPDTAYITGQDYLGAFAEGRYPVSTYNEEMYKHDIEDDHLTAMVLGGEPLKLALKDVAERALDKSEEEVHGIAAQIDTFTATLRAVIAPHASITGEAYGEEQGRMTLIDEGTRLGMDRSTVEQILSTAQTTAKTLDMQVTELK